MPAFKKITSEEYNIAESTPIEAKLSTIRDKKSCTSVQVFDGRKVLIKNDLGVLVPRGRYNTVVFVPNELLGDIRWNRVFGKRTNRWTMQVTNKGVAFLFGRLTP